MSIKTKKRECFIYYKRICETKIIFFFILLGLCTFFKVLVLASWATGFTQTSIKINNIFYIIIL